ncbi:MAG: hypothetical protein II257_03180, partial [Clostridia bacterium]|nr:hypothetical protein [Clostridia bacterium]
MLKSDNSKNVKNDLILVGVILSLSLIGFFIFKLTMKDGNLVSVSINGDEKYKYSITDNLETDIITGDDDEN